MPGKRPPLTHWDWTTRPEPEHGPEQDPVSGRHPVSEQHPIPDHQRVSEQKGQEERGQISIANAAYSSVMPDGRIRCEVCPRFCQLRDGQRGLCFVRARKGDNIVLTTYGRSSGFCVDPIEKKPLNHFLPGTPVLSFGTAGCNLACKFCQNWDISKSRQMERLSDEASPQQLADAALDVGARSIAYTYNDPVIFLEYAMDVAAAAHEVGVQSVAVTAGYVCDSPRRAFFDQMDAANVDLKAFTQKFYHNICGGSLAPVLDTLLYLRQETNVWFEITNLLIPGENDSPSEIEAMSNWLVDNLGRDIPLHFTAFHPEYRMLEHDKTPANALTRARDIAISAGLNYVYTGNVVDKVGGSTYCPGCREQVIGRDRYQLGEWNLDAQSCCLACGTRVAGVFEEKPADWGPKRLPIKIKTKTSS